MQSKFTQRNLGSFSAKIFAFIMILATMATASYSQVQLYNEGFSVVSPLPAGWAQQNLSTPVGTTPTWIQGVSTIFPAHTGGPNEYILCTFNSVAGADIISNWLFAPTVTLTNGDTFSFWTRTVTAPAFPDRLQVRMSTNGASVNVGTTNTSVGDFSILLLDINPTYTVTDYPNDWTLQTIVISGLAAPVSGRIAFRYFVEDGGPFGNNSDNIGIDDVIYFQAPPCTGTPSPGNTLAEDSSVCTGIPFTLSIANPTVGSGVSYQWQSSTTLAGPYTNIAGATASTYTAIQTATTYYQVIVTCGGASGTSTPIQVSITAPSGCYCTSTATNIADEDIFNVSIGTLNNTSSCTSLAPGFGSVVSLYSNYTSGSGAPAAGTIVSGGTNPFSVGIGTCGTFNYINKIAIWIDYNQNGSFDAAEKVYVSPSGFPAGAHVETGNIFIPASAPNGVTRMRVVNVETANAAAIQPCGTYTWGETEDYLVNIVPCTPLTITNQPDDATTSCGGNAIFTASASGSNPDFRWEYRTSPATPWLFVINDATFSGATNDTLTLTAVSESMNGYEFRAVFTGSCTAVDFTDSATLTVTQLVATVDPTSATICNGGAPQLLTITNSAAAPTTITIASPALTLAVPDNTADGVSSTLAVTGVPAGAIVSAMSVKINMTHTYCGDMIFNLKAPNNSILALDKYLTATGNAAGPLPNIGFVNTVISSEGTLPLSTASTQPITGTFRADALNTIPFLIQNPTGFVSDASSFDDLFSVPNGTWTLAMADGGPADLGVLTSWSIDVTYVSPVPATGIWSPATGLYNDLALTSPYDGITPVSSVYAAPTVSTDYTVTVSTATCTSAPTVIPVTVVNTIGSVTQPADTNVCRGSNITFTADVSSGGPASYQWQVSTDGGATWTDVVNGGEYSGATTNTLTLTNVPASFNNNQYRLVLSVTACASSITTDAASLTVSENPTVAISVAPFTTLYPGLTTVLSAVLTPATSNSTFQWFLNGDTIPGATGSTFEAGVDGLGNYSVIATNASGCSASSADDIIITDSLNTSLFIYPNPSTGLFQVRYNDKINGLSSARTVTAYDSKGARVFSSQYTVTTPFGRMNVDLRNYPKGIYVIELTDISGNRLGAERVIIF